MAELIWGDALGYGFYPVEADPAKVYDSGYWEKYCLMAESPMGEAITAFRLNLVMQHFPQAQTLIDVGIGSGQFIEAVEAHVERVYGCDVNPIAVQWLNEKEAYADPLQADAASVDVLTFWDSLEHLPSPSQFLRAAKGVCVSMPIYSDREHVLRSKHFRPDEHFWYFTEWGFIDYMKRLGFKLIGGSRGESRLGREDIGTFAFRRV